MAQYDMWDMKLKTLIDPPHLEEGMWIRWTTQDRIWEGQITYVKWPSVLIRWVGTHEDAKVFPNVQSYFPPDGTGMEIIDKPRSADKIAKDARAGHMSVKRAAALLGVEPKRVRAMLRGGQLRGERVDGKWKLVNGEDVMAKLP